MTEAVPVAAMRSALKAWRKWGKPDPLRLWNELVVALDERDWDLIARPRVIDNVDDLVAALHEGRA